MNPFNVIKVVCKHTNVRITDLYTASRKGNIMVARQMSMYLLKKRMKLPYTQIAKVMTRNKKPFNHTTVINNVNTFQNLLDTNDPLILPLYNEVISVLESDEDFPKERGPRIIVYYADEAVVHDIVKLLNKNFDALSYEFE